MVLRSAAAGSAARVLLLVASIDRGLLLVGVKSRARWFSARGAVHMEDTETQGTARSWTGLDWMQTKRRTETETETHGK